MCPVVTQDRYTYLMDEARWEKKTQCPLTFVNTGLCRIPNDCTTEQLGQQKRLCALALYDAAAFPSDPCTFGGVQHQLSSGVSVGRWIVECAEKLRYHGGAFALSPSDSTTIEVGRMMETISIR